MSVPAPSDPRWGELLSGAKDPAFTALATKLMVGRLRQQVKQQPAVLPKAVEELRHYFSTNAFAQRDLALI